MTLEQLTTRYFRLQQELSIAYQQRPWHSGRIDRLAKDLATTEREIGGLQGGDGRPGAGSSAAYQ